MVLTPAVNCIYKLHIVSVQLSFPRKKKGPESPGKLIFKRNIIFL